MKRYIAAIDLGTTKVVSLVGEKTDSGYKIVSFREAPSKGVMRGEVVNIQNVLDSLIPTIKEIKQEDGIEISEVYVGIAGQNIKCNTARHSRNRGKSDELISEKEIEEMEQDMFNSRVSAGEKILHVMPQSYNVDDHIGVKDPVGMTGTQIEGDYKIFIGKINSVEHSKLVINRAGLILKDLILEPVASARAVLSEDEMELGVAMVDMGGGTTDLLIYEDNIVRHTAVIPFGGNSITEDLRQGCGVSSRNAEQMKIQYGSCYSEYAPENKTVIIPGIGGRESREVSFRVIAGIIEARVEEIIEAIMYEIENSGYQDKIRAGIVITGGGSQLTNLCQFVKFKTGFDTRIASPNNSITFDSCEGVCKPSSSTAVGLIIKGFESEKSAKQIAEQEQHVATLFPKEQLPEVISDKGHKGQSDRREKRHGSFINQTLGVLGGIFDNSDNEA
ncbi:MAG: cell division protein FtsA [Bacteroidetes bacterium GWF2_40_14]|nr:MAG: cell division protein FtsA [Bacteroidetes bacterium GWF2_40_14]